jgi:hypothetical protein
MNIFTMMLYGFTLENHYGGPGYVLVFFSAAGIGTI